MCKKRINKKILFVTGEGIGNVIQTIPTIRTLKEVLGYSVDMWHAFGSFPIKEKIIPYVDNWYFGEDIKNTIFNNYIGVVATYWVRNHIKPLLDMGIPLLNSITPMSMDRSEVDVYMDIARDLGVKEEAIVWHGDCGYNECKTVMCHDVSIHNGYNPYGSANWSIKEYPYYEKVAELLIKEGLLVVSFGKEHEYINGTIDMTRSSLLNTFAKLGCSKVFLGNDSGLYHAANALGVPNVAIFTATSTKKNYDKRFHRYTTIIGRDDLKCRPCQGERRWTKDCKTWDCREVDPNTIFKIVMKKLEEIR